VLNGGRQGKQPFFNPEKNGGGQNKVFSISLQILSTRCFKASLRRRNASI
jgi:hypothetical protein